MKTSPTAQYTDFSRDVIGRYVCNSLEEALLSMDPNDRPDAGRGPRPEARPFDIIIVGGGTFGASAAQQLFANDLLKKHRILVLEAGPFVLPEHVQNLPWSSFGSRNHWMKPNGRRATGLTYGPARMPMCSAPNRHG